MEDRISHMRIIWLTYLRNIFSECLWICGRQFLNRQCHWAMWLCCLIKQSLHKKIHFRARHCVRCSASMWSVTRTTRKYSVINTESLTTAHTCGSTYLLITTNYGFIQWLSNGPISAFISYELWESFFLAIQRSVVYICFALLSFPSTNGKKIYSTTRKYKKSQIMENTKRTYPLQIIVRNQLVFCPFVGERK